MGESQEQLIAKLRAQLAEAEQKAKQAEDARKAVAGLAIAKEKELARLDEELKTEKNRVASAEAENARLKKELEKERNYSQALKIGSGDTLRGCLAVLKEFRSQIKDLPAAEYDQLTWLLNRAKLEAGDTSHAFNARFFRRLVGHGNEKLKKLKKQASKDPTPSVEEVSDDLQKAVKKMDRSIKGNQAEAEATSSLIGPVLVEMSNDPAHAGNVAIQAAATIETIPVPEKTRKPAEEKTSRGRQRLASKSDSSCPSHRIELRPGTECRCGKGILMSIGTAEHVLRELSNWGKNTKEGYFGRQVCFCEACQQVTILDDGEMPLPYNAAPGVQVGVEIAACAGMVSAGGVSFNKVEDLMGAGYVEQLGTETISRAAQNLAEKNGAVACLFRRIWDKAMKAQAILCDETPFRVLEKEKGTSYVLAVSSPPGADEHFCLFAGLGSRSTEAIGEKLKGFKCTIMATDAYRAYDAFVKSHNARCEPAAWIILQACLVHFRREIYECLDYPEIKKGLQDKDKLSESAKNFGGKTPVLILLEVLEGLAKIYAIEQSLKRWPDESRELHLERIRKARAGSSTKLMDCIDQLMTQLAPEFAVQKGGSGTWEKKNSSPFAAPVVYYMNAREKLRTFLTHPEISPDTNLVEQSIRPIALYKSTAFFKRSRKGLDSFCAYSSLRSTAFRNGIRYPENWVRKFCRAFVLHCWEYDLGVRARKFAGLGKKPMPTAVHAFSAKAAESFDYESWLPWNYVKRLPPEERCEPES